MALSGWLYAMVLTEGAQERGFDGHWLRGGVPIAPVQQEWGYDGHWLRGGCPSRRCSRSGVSTVTGRVGGAHRAGAAGWVGAFGSSGLGRSGQVRYLDVL